MTSFLDEPQARYLGTAIFMLGVAYTVIRWVGRTLREQLGAGASRSEEAFAAAVVEAVPPSLVKEAISRGLITPSQFAALSPMERQFLLASFKEKLGPSAPTADGTAGAASPSPSGASGGAGTAPAAKSHLPRPLSGAEFGLAAVPADDARRVYCPMCGDRLDLPAFVPLVARCGRCGAKSAVRDEEGGRFVIIVSPPLPPEPGHERQSS